MDIKVIKERVALEKIEKVFDIEVNGHVIKISKWYYFDESGAFEDGWSILNVEEYGDLEDKEQVALSDFVDNIKLN